MSQHGQLYLILIVSTSIVRLPIRLSVCLYVCLFLHLSDHLSVCVYVWLSVGCLCVCLCLLCHSITLVSMLSGPCWKSCD